MKNLDFSLTKIDFYVNNLRKPDFTNILKVLDNKAPQRPTLFEFYLNDELYLNLANATAYSLENSLNNLAIKIKAHRNAGYDYCTVMGSSFGFKTNRNQGHKTISLNEGTVISDEKSFEDYIWNEPENYDYSNLEKLSAYLPEGMKLIVHGPDGVLENVISLVGYDQLCYMIADNEDLVGRLFENVGSRLLKYYEISAEFDTVGALISNDDWGFGMQTMLRVEDMRKYVFPWHKRIVEAIHKRGKPAILHSCGNLDKVMDDIIVDMKYDAKHSFEDKIIPVEEAYKKWGERIAILGGIDINFLCTSTPEEIYERSARMLDISAEKGGYALGSGNSIPNYVPESNYLAMIAAANHY